jgi:hypothetical protein
VRANNCKAYGLATPTPLPKNFTFNKSIFPSELASAINWMKYFATFAQRIAGDSSVANTTFANLGKENRLVR